MLTEARPPSVEEIRRIAATLAGRIVPTPVLRCPALEAATRAPGPVLAKLEFLQVTGTFKARGALSVLTSLDAAQREAGVTAVSAGNHAIAVAFAARSVGASAKVVMTRSANPWRVHRCRQFGAEVVFAEDVHSAFELAEEIRGREGRYFVHPFEGPEIVRGTATLGLEICEQVPDAEAVVVPIGGGGLCAGVASAVKQLRPGCRVYGVEPEGADTMRRSIAAGEPTGIERIATIADSLGAPYALPYSFALCRDHVDEFVTVTDAALRDTMAYLFHEMKIAVEPACAATTAALLGPLEGLARERKTVLVMCGSNIDWQTFAAQAGLDQTYAA